MSKQESAQGPIEDKLKPAIDRTIRILLGTTNPILNMHYAVEDILIHVQALITTETTKLAKAYGGCTLCYGKGYATVNDRWHGHDTDQDIGSPGGYISGGNANAMKFCTCDRGKQLSEQFTKAALQKEQNQ